MRPAALAFALATLAAAQGCKEAARKEGPALDGVLDKPLPASASISGSVSPAEAEKLKAALSGALGKELDKDAAAPSVASSGSQKP